MGCVCIRRGDLIISPHEFTVKMAQFKGIFKFLICAYNDGLDNIMML